VLGVPFRQPLAQRLQLQRGVYGVSPTRMAASAAVCAAADTAKSGSPMFRYSMRGVFGGKAAA